MKLAIICNQSLREEWLRRPVPPEVAVVFTGDTDRIPPDADVLFDLLFENQRDRISALRQFLPKPVFVNAVDTTLAEIGEPFIRINAWPGFLDRDILELAALPEQQAGARKVITALNRHCELLPDIAGLVAARVVTMIINEAWFAFGAGVSTKQDIDTAMQLGTNYPMGPFAWGEKIGLHRVYRLLLRLEKEDKEHYGPAPSLVEALKSN